MMMMMMMTMMITTVPLQTIQKSDIVVVTSLPRTASNKIMRRVLRDQYVENYQASGHH